MVDTAPKTRWYRPTPGWLVVLLLATTGFLYLSEWFQWFSFNSHKGWTVLIAVAAVGVVLVLMLLWLVVALIFRWRFQFSIRSLLVLVLAVALPFSWLTVEMKRAGEQEKTVNALMKAGCSVWYDYDKQKFGRFWLSPVRIPTTLPEWPWLIRLFGRDFFHYADQVDCTQLSAAVSDAELAQAMPRLSTLPALTTLSMQSFRISNNALWPLKNLQGIRNLDVNMNLDDVGLKHIATIKQLETLNIHNSTVTDDGLTCLRGHAELRCLFLYSQKVTQRSVSVFASLPKLEELILYDCDLTDDDLAELRREKPHLKCDFYLMSAARKARFNKSAKSPPVK